MGESANQRPCCGPAFGKVWRTSLLSVAVAAQLMLAPIALGQQQAPTGPFSAAPTGTVQQTAIVLARELRDLSPPLSLLDFPPQDDGVAGARLAVNDNNTTGRFLKQEFTLDVVQSGSVSELISEVTKRVDAGCWLHCRRHQRRKRCCALADALEGARCIDHQCRLGRRPAAGKRIAGPMSCTRHRPGPCWPMGWRSILCGSSGAAGSWCAAPVPTTRPLPRRCGAPPSGSGPRSWRSAHSRSKPAAGAPTADTSRSSSRSRPSPRMPPLTTCCWWPTKAASSASIFPTALGTRDRWRERRDWCPPAGTRRSSSGGQRSFRTAFGAWPAAPCVRSTTTCGSPSAQSARPPRAPSR